MLRSLLAFELKLHTRQVGFWVALVIMFAVGVLFSSLEMFSSGGERVKTNGAIPIAALMSSFSLFSIFFAAVFVVTGVMRDETHKSIEIIHATSVKSSHMILSRMIGVWAATVLSLTGLAIGTTFGPFMPWGDPETFKSFNILHYIQPFFLFIVINALLVSGIYAAIASITRNRAIVYVSAVGLLVLYLLASVVAGERPDDWVAALVDPFGATSLIVETQFWPAAEQNENMAPMSGWVGINRLFYTLIGLALFGLAFIFSSRGITTKRSKKRAVDGAYEIPVRVSPTTPETGLGFAAKAFWTRLKFEYVTTVRSTAFMILVGIALALFGFTLLVMALLGASTTLPTSRVMTQIALGSLTLPMLIIMVFFGSDIMWRDRTANLHGILDATPVRNVSLLFAKWGALALVLLTLIVGLLLAGMTAQLGLGWQVVPVVPMTFIAIGLISFFVGFFFQGMLVMFLQNFMPGRIIGMLVGGAVLVGLIFFIGRLPFYHPLMNFGSVGAGAYSEMAGFSSPQSFGWEFAYWMGLIVILGVLSIWVWRRGMDSTFQNPGVNRLLIVISMMAFGIGLIVGQTYIENSLISGLMLWPGIAIALVGFIGLCHQIGLFDRIRRNATGPSIAVAAIGTMLFVGFGYAGLQSYQDQDYMNSDQREASSAEFEKLVGDLWKDPDPRIIDVSVEADFFPRTGTATFKGRYIVDNPHDGPIERAYISVSSLENLTDIDFEGGQTLTGEEPFDSLREDYNVLTIQFNPPILPNETRTVEFTRKFRESTLTANSRIRGNGTFVNNTAALITFGNLDSGFLRNPDTRRKYDLGERIRWPSRDDEDARREHLLTAFSGYADYVDFEANICTDDTQIPVAPGKFRSEIVQDGRRCRYYKSINPILNFFSFVTAEYEVRKDVWAGNGQTVDLEIYFHPEHNYNIDIMIEAMKTSLDTYTELFSPYQYAQLRIMEFPYGGFAQAFAGTVPFSENIGFVQDPGDAEDPKAIDFATYVTMHEVGHQWFAHQVIGAFAEGSNLLSEGLTEYVTMLAYERHYDAAKARRVHEDRTTVSYLTARTFESSDEPVLARAETQAYLNYNKASWVLWGMRGIIGEDPVLRAVRRFLLEHGADKGAPYPTTLELISILREETDPQYHNLIEDYWNNITFWDLGFQDAEMTVVETDNGQFEVTLPLTIDKKYADEDDGRETSVTEMDDKTLGEFVPVGFYKDDPKESLGINPLALETIFVSEADPTITFTLDERPTHVMLDPDRRLMERNVNDNIKQLDTASES